MSVPSNIQSKMGVTVNRMIIVLLMGEYLNCIHKKIRKYFEHLLKRLVFINFSSKL